MRHEERNHGNSRWGSTCSLNCVTHLISRHDANWTRVTSSPFSFLFFSKENSIMTCLFIFCKCLFEILIIGNGFIQKFFVFRKILWRKFEIVFLLQVIAMNSFVLIDSIYFISHWENLIVRNFSCIIYRVNLK